MDIDSSVWGGLGGGRQSAGGWEASVIVSTTKKEQVTTVRSEDGILNGKFIVPHTEMISTQRQPKT